MTRLLYTTVQLFAHLLTVIETYMTFISVEWLNCEENNQMYQRASGESGWCKCKPEL